MKHFIVAFVSSVLMFLTVPVSAGPHRDHGFQHRHHNFHHHNRHYHHVYRHRDWIVPAIIGGTIVYAATRPDPVIVQQPTVVLQPNQVIIDGVVYTKQIMIINGVQTEVLVKQ